MSAVLSRVSVVPALLELEVQELETFSEIIRHYEKEDEEQFAIIVKIATEKKRISITDFCDRFGITRGTVSRWATGKACPHLYIRPVVIQWVEQKVRELAIECRNENRMRYQAEI